MNPYVYNPAYAGVDGHAVIFAMYKQQWSKISDGPTLSHATYHVPLRGGVGFGVMAFNDSRGPLNSTGGKATGSYLINLDRKHFVRLGMSLGAGTRTLTLPEDAISDPAFQGQGTTYLIGDFGATYHFDHFNVGFSLPNLFGSEVISEEGTSIQLNPTDYMLFKMNYRGHINHEIAIEPHILYRYSSVLPSQYEIATIVHLKHIAWVGGTYRQDAGLIALLGFQIKNTYAVGAAFELGNSNYNDLTGSTFEIHLGMHLGGHKEKKLSHVEHHRTWFQTHDEDKIREAELKRRRDSILAAQQNSIPVNQTDPNELGIVKDPIPKVTRTEGWAILPGTVQITGDPAQGKQIKRQGANGDEFVVSFPPARNGGSAWALAPTTGSYEEKSDDGERMVGVKWVRIKPDGSLAQEVKWEPVLDAAGVAALLAGSQAQKDPIETVKDPVVTEPTVTDPTIGETENIADPTLTTDGRDYKEISESTTPLIVTRGKSMIELPVGFHLIGGVFDDLESAEEFSQRMFHRGFRDNRLGYVSARGHYYVVLRSYPNLERAEQDKNRVNKGAGLSEIWVLQVNE